MINQLTGGLEFPKRKENDNSDFDLDQSSKYDININFNPVPSTLPLEERINLIKLIGEEIIREEDLKKLLTEKQFPICYDGFEPSGRLHIAEGIFRILNVNRLVKAGCVFVFWIADLFALMNNKMGGDLEKIKLVGRYYIEIWKAAGLDLRNVKFLWASEEINKNPKEYWSTVIDIASKTKLDRMKQCSQAIGRTNNEDYCFLQASHIFYPCMQITDILYLNVDICQLGLDQKEINVVAEEYYDKIKKDKPIIISHHMLIGLGIHASNQKMSKGDPENAIFMEDSIQEVKSKIIGSYFVEQDINSPVVEYIKYIIFPVNSKFLLKREEKYGGNVEYTSYNDFEKDFLAGETSPPDIKYSVIDAINAILEPVRKHFENDPYAKSLIESVKKFQIRYATPIH